jgi:nuclear GTP-binding protein
MHPEGDMTVVGSDPDGVRPERRDGLFAKGQSKRIWGELYKVVDSSDVLIQVLDARDPIGTRCAHLEAHLKERTQRHRHMVLILNKCDLVPAWVTKRWLHALSREYPTVAFHASMTHPFGKGALLSLLRQFQRLHADKPNISVGFIGYPNVGKSSVINTLRTKKVCTVAPVPGETKVWQYVNLTKKIFLIDCPGVVYSGAGDTDTDAVLKGVVRVANLDDPTEHVAEVLNRVKPEYLRRAYRVQTWEDSHDFLSQLARITGKLLRGGEPDCATAAKALLLDWQRGRIPFFKSPPPLPPRAEEGLVVASGAMGAGAAPATAPPPAPHGADPATRAAATAERAAFRDAELVAAHAADALRRQVARGLPSARGMFSEEDAANPDGDDDPSLAQPGAGGSDDDASDDDAADDDDDDASDGSDADADADAAGGAGAAEEDEDADSDGYGSEGLTWEAVMADIRGGAKPNAPAAAAGGDAAAAAAAAPAAKGGKGKKKSGKAAAAAAAASDDPAVAAKAAAKAARERKAAEVEAARAAAAAEAAPATGGKRRRGDDEPAKPARGSRGARNPAAAPAGQQPAAKKAKRAAPASGMYTTE